MTEQTKTTKPQTIEVRGITAYWSNSLNCYVCVPASER